MTGAGGPPLACRVVVFFSRGMSLDGWREAGIAERELSLLSRLRSQVASLALVTYGGPAELQWQDVVPGVEILTNRWGLGSNAYSLLAPWLHRARLRGTDVFRTQQINGAWAAVIARRLFGGRLVVRGGFVWSSFVARMGASPLRRAITTIVERLVVRSADCVVMAGADDAAEIVRRHRVDRDRIRIVPNFVDTSRFRPLPDVPAEPGHIVFVGRFEEQKNVAALIDAMRGLTGARLTLVGEGSLRSALEARVRELGVAGRFVGRMPNSALPPLLNSAALYVMPSLYEGNPKAITEAMACGVAVLGTRVPGISTLIEHGVNGYLCGTSASNLHDAMRRLLADDGLRAKLGHAGMTSVQSRFSLEAAVAAERAVLDTLR
jgi:glycosyltransferase involved in cell wall biosynthesis